MPPTSRPPASLLPPAPLPSRRAILALGLAAGASSLFAPLAGGRAMAAPLVVEGADALARALDRAAPGTVLRLVPGDYGTLARKGAFGGPGAPVTLTAADPARPPRFERMDIRESGHLVLENLLFDYRFAAGDAKKLRPFQITGSTGVALKGVLFDGDEAQGVSEIDDGHGYGFGLTMRGCTGVALNGCEIRKFHNGLHINRSKDIRLTANNLHSMRMDGMKFAAIEGMVIEGNRIHDFNRALDSKDHADMIQFWTKDTKTPSRDITIRGNLLYSGTGFYTQSIFMRNEEVDSRGKGSEMFYRNILIEENVIANAHLHGISVGQTVGLTIRRNTLIRNALSATGSRRLAASGEARENLNLRTPRIGVAKTSADVRIEKNVVASITGHESQPDWVVADNFLVQDRSRARPGFYEAVFEGNPVEPESLAYRRGGPLYGAGIGASRLQRG